jgi:hypothetical protein
MILMENMDHTIFFRSSSDIKGNGALSGVLEKREKKQAKRPEEVICCGNCLHVISDPDQQMAVEGSVVHTFANPLGIVFEIVCLKTAPGTGTTGSFTDEFTWFKGYQWKGVVCGKCLIHLGWLFRGESGHSFSGLITDRLIFPE